MRLNQFVRNTAYPPIPEAASWVEGRQFSNDKPLIDLSQAVPGYATSRGILDHMAKVLTDMTTGSYGPVLGLAELREAYADHLSSGSSESILTSNVAITAGCNQAFYVAIAALCTPGDEVILPSPWYFNHKMSLEMLGINAVPLPCLEQKQLIPEAEIAAQLINRKTKALVLISPNNPTGKQYPPETIDAFYHLCQSQNIALIVDETYRDFREQPDTAPHSIFDDPDWSDTAIHLYSFSKAYALAGYRVGALVSSERVNHEATKVLDCIAICAARISQQAALHGLRHAAAWKEEKRQLMLDRAGAFKEAMNECHYSIAAMGAYFAYLKHPHGSIPSRTVARDLAENANLLTLPGDMFGDDQHSYLRFAFANVSSSLMPTIAARLNTHELRHAR